MTLAVDVLDRLADAEALAPAWRDLLARSAAPSPMRGPAWLLTWWRVFGEGGARALRVVTVRDGDRLIGVAPLLWRVARERRLVPLRRIELLGTGEDERDEICSDYVGLIAERGREDAAAAAVGAAIARGRLGPWDDVVLAAMPEDDPCAAPLARALGVAIARVQVAPFGRCRYVPLPSSWGGYLASLRARDRYLVTRTLRDLDAWSGGDHRLVRARTAADLADGQQILRALHTERWRGASAGGGDGGHGERDGERDGGVFASARFARFHEEVMPKLLHGGPDGALDLSWLVARGRPIAVLYNLEHDGRVFFYQSGRALDLPKGIRPGIAVHALAIRRAIDEGKREYDFLNGESQYKAQLAPAARGLVTLRATALHARARALEAVREGIDRALALRRRLTMPHPTGPGAANGAAAGDPPRTHAAARPAPERAVGPRGGAADEGRRGGTATVGGGEAP